MIVGSFTVLTGAMALLLSKGTWLHKLSGRLFVLSMILMGPIVGAGVLLTPGSISSLGVFFVFFIIYLVITAWSTIHNSDSHVGLIEVLGPFFAFGIFITGLYMGICASDAGSVDADWSSNEAFFFFSTFAFATMILDVNNLRCRGVQGKHRIVRHVWRMSCALFFATSSLFTGPGSIVFPESIRTSPILSVPQFLVLIISLLWIWRILYSKRTFILR